MYGLSAKESTIGSAVFPGYGVYFSRDIPTSFVLYKDTDGNKKYNHVGDGTNCSANSECLESVSIPNGDTIKDICATLGAVTNCASVSQIDFVNVVFTRPDPEANITGTLGAADTVYDNLQISVKTPKDFFKTVTVWSTGQVSVQN